MDLMFWRSGAPGGGRLGDSGLSRGAIRRAAIALLLLSCIMSSAAMAQTQSLEFQAGQGGPGGNGPSVANQAVTLQLNTNNPTGTTFAGFTPATTATFSLSNQQYAYNATTAPQYTAGNGFPTGAGVMFGATVNTAINPATAGLYTPMNSIAAPAGNQFTSANSAATTGITVAVNGSVRLFLSARALQVASPAPSTTSRVQMADLTVTFSSPIRNPILHFVGMGGNYDPTAPGGILGFTAEYDLIQVNGAAAPANALTRLSGNPVLSVAGNSVNNSATTPNSSCSASDEGACGSVRINATGVTSLVFRMFLRGDGGAAAWGSSGWHGGDAMNIGVSLEPFQMLNLAKNWAAGSTTGHTATATTTGGGNNATFTSTAATNTAGTAVTVYANEALTLPAETFGGGAVTESYQTMVACAGGNALAPAAPPRTLTISASLTATTCTYTNTPTRADLQLTKTNTPGVNGDVDQASDTVTSGSTTTYEIRVTNNGPDNVTGAVLRDTPGANLNCPASNTVTITGNGVPAGGYTLANLTAGIALDQPDRSAEF